MEKEEKWREYPATIEMYEAMREGIMEGAGMAGLSESAKDILELGIEEMLVNIINYAYDEAGLVWIRTLQEGEFFRMDLADNGRPFNPLAEPTRNPYDDDDEDIEEGGLGIFLVKKNFPRIEYAYEDFDGKKANILSLWLKI